MTELVLTGLRGSHTLGALAAFGLLRVASRLDLPQPVRLSWIAQPDWVARLSFPEPVTEERLLDGLVPAVKARAASPELAWRDDLKPLPAEYHDYARAWLAEAAPDRREILDFLAAFGAEPLMMRNGKGLKPTALDMTSASNKFLRDLRKAVTQLAGATNLPARLVEALFGPWRQQDDVFAMGWNCEAERLHAHEALAPTKLKHGSVIGAIWLAYESLPLFPTASVAGKLATTAFDAQGGAFTWPIWETPLELMTVRSLLGLAELTMARPPLASLRLRGIRAVYRSQRAKLMQGRATLRPAVLV